MITYQAWRDKYVERCDIGLYVHCDGHDCTAPQHAITVSEASGYGLSASLFANRRDDFELFLAFYNKHENSQGLMAWQQVNLEGRILDDQEPQSNGGGSAPDGDLDAAYALLLAGRRWEHTAYTDRGIQVCAALWKWCINDETLVTNLGDWCLTGYGLQQMHPDMVYNNVSRPSDYMLTHFLLFSQIDTERTREWEQVLEASIEVLQHQLELHPDTGLLADFLVYNPAEKRYKPAEGKVLEREQDGSCGWNSCRMPWRLATYWIKTQDKRVLPLLKAQQHFFEGQEKILAGYKLDGTPLVTYCNIAFLAPVWCLFKAMDSHKLTDVEKQIHDMHGWGIETYYGESLEVLAGLQMHAGSNFL